MSFISNTHTNQIVRTSSATIQTCQTNDKLIVYSQISEPPTYFTEVKKSKRFPGPEIENCYKMRSRNRGIAFIVNIINFKRNTRNGAHVDRVHLVNMWQQMGFVVYYYQDTTKQEFVNLFKLLAASDILRDTECLTVSIMSHGRLIRDMDTVEFTDNKTEFVHNIVGQFSDTACPNMLNKPRVFFFSICRESNVSCNLNPPAVEVTQQSVNSPDIMVCFATSKGCTAYRDRYVGSWYINALCKVFSEHSHNTHLKDLLILIAEQTEKKSLSEGCTQTPNNVDNECFVNLYFNPGWYE